MKTKEQPPSWTVVHHLLLPETAARLHAHHRLYRRSIGEQRSYVRRTTPPLPLSHQTSLGHAAVIFRLSMPSICGTHWKRVGEVGVDDATTITVADVVGGRRMEE